MAADPSAVHAMKRYGNWTPCKGRQGEFGVVRIDDGSLWEAWHLFYRDLDAGEVDRTRVIKEIAEDAVQRYGAVLDALEQYDVTGELPTWTEQIS